MGSSSSPAVAGGSECDQLDRGTGPGRHSQDQARAQPSRLPEVRGHDRPGLGRLSTVPSVSHVVQVAAVYPPFLGGLQEVARAIATELAAEGVTSEVITSG